MIHSDSRGLVDVWAMVMVVVERVVAVAMTNFKFSKSSGKKTLLPLICLKCPSNLSCLKVTNKIVKSYFPQIKK